MLHVLAHYIYSVGPMWSYSSCILLLSQIRINFTHCVLLYFFIQSIISLILGYLYIYLRYSPAYTIREICYSRSYPSANDKIFSFVPKCTQLISWYFDQRVADQRSLFVVFSFDFVKISHTRFHTCHTIRNRSDFTRPIIRQQPYYVAMSTSN